MAKPSRSADTHKAPLLLNSMPWKTLLASHSKTLRRHQCRTKVSRLCSNFVSRSGIATVAVRGGGGASKVQLPSRSARHERDMTRTIGMLPRQNSITRPSASSNRACYPHSPSAHINRKSHIATPAGKSRRAGRKTPGVGTGAHRPPSQKHASQGRHAGTRTPSLQLHRTGEGKIRGFPRALEGASSFARQLRV